MKRLVASIVVNSLQYYYDRNMLNRQDFKAKAKIFTDKIMNTELERNNYIVDNYIRECIESFVRNRMKDFN